MLAGQKRLPIPKAFTETLTFPNICLARIPLVGRKPLNQSSYSSDLGKSLLPLECDIFETRRHCTMAHATPSGVMGRHVVTPMRKASIFMYGSLVAFSKFGRR
jgi:hypothetical protein